MKKLSLLLTCFINVNLLLSQHSIEKKTGYTITTITKTDIGEIKIYLPDDIRAGETISGTVSVSPSGKKAKDIEKNRQLLSSSNVTIGTVGFPVIKGISGNIKLNKEQIENLPIKVSTADGAVLYQTVLPGLFLNSGLTSTTFKIPSHILSGSPFKISGNFDGNASNTQCRLDGKEIKIIAESPRMAIYQMPGTISGSHTITIEENGKSTEQKTSCVTLDMTADKTNLRTGQQSIITAIISGLQNLPANAVLTMSNVSSNTVALVGGNNQAITITPSQVNTTGVYTQTFTVQSLTTGNFTLNADLVLPEPASTGNNNSTVNTGTLCNCYINQQTYLIPHQTCITLGGSLNPQPVNNIQPDLSGTGSTAAPIVYFPPPEPMNVQTGQINLQLNAPSNNVVAVIFSTKPVSGTNWNPVGNAVNTGNNWQSNWTPPLGNDGEHMIRARIAGKNNVVTERFTQTHLLLTPNSINPAAGEKINLTVSDEQIKDADQKTKRISDSLRIVQEKLDSLQQRYDELRQSQEENSSMSGELVVIDAVLDQIPGNYSDSLKALIDSLKNIKTNLPEKADPAALQKAADDAAQRQKDCEDRLNKLKTEKDQAQKDLGALNEQIENLLDQMDQLHLGNNWIGGHGYHADGSFWYGYVGDERSNTNINAQSNALAKQLRDLKGPQNKANDRVKALNKEIADAEVECDKLKKEKEKAEQAVKDGDLHAATETQIDELCRQIESLMSALKDWLAAHPEISGLDAELPANPRTPEELQAYLDNLNNIINNKIQKEADLKKESEENAADAEATEDAIGEAEDDKNNLEAAQAAAQAEADKLKAEREKQLEAERAAQRKKEEEDNAKKNTPKPEPTLPVPIYPSEMQLKFQAISLLRGLYREYLISKGPCDCITKAIALANNTNTAATDIIGGMAVGVAFAPLEVFPGFSFAARLGIGAAKALGSALFGGENFTDELAKNLFNEIGGEIFPKLTGSDVAGNSLNSLAGKGLDAILKAEGVIASSWEGETNLRGCGNVKGKTTMLFNPNTGWVTLLIKIDNCPLIVIKYKVNKDGVPVSKPSVTKVG